MINSLNLKSVALDFFYSKNNCTWTFKSDWLIQVVIAIRIDGCYIFNYLLIIFLCWLWALIVCRLIIQHLLIFQLVLLRSLLLFFIHKDDLRSINKILIYAYLLLWILGLLLKLFFSLSFFGCSNLLGVNGAIGLCGLSRSDRIIIISRLLCSLLLNKCNLIWNLRQQLSGLRWLVSYSQNRLLFNLLISLSPLLLSLLLTNLLLLFLSERSGWIRPDSMLKWCSR